MILSLANCRNDCKADRWRRNTASDAPAVTTAEDAARRGHVGAFWVTFLGHEQCEILGGRDEGLWPAVPKIMSGQRPRASASLAAPSTDSETSDRTRSRRGDRRHRAVPFRTRVSEDIEQPVHIYFSIEPDMAQQEAIRRVIAAWAAESPRFQTDPDEDGFHEVRNLPVRGRTMRWIIGFGSVDVARALRRLARLLADLGDVPVERIFVGTETVR